jgi:hypothetical protein
LISVRSEVQIFPGPPAFAASSYGQAKPRDAKAVAPKRERRRTEIGAIAQLGERLLCKQEVVGSIPSGSTNPVGAAVDLSVGWPDVVGPEMLVALMLVHASEFVSRRSSDLRDAGCLTS